MDFDVLVRKFRVIKRVEVPRSEYSYDNAVNMIVDLNEQYNPSWIYCDRGAGEYQIERLQIIGDEKPHTGLKHKVKGWQFKNTIEVPNPITKTYTKEPLKPFMVNRLVNAFDRENILLSPFDEDLHKQLIDYEVERISASGIPVYSKNNDHFVDALGLSFLAFVLEFPELTNEIQNIEVTNKIAFVNRPLGAARLNAAFNEMQSQTNAETKAVLDYDPTELPGDRPRWVKVNPGYRSGASTNGTWGSRAGGATRSGNPGRKMW